MSTLTLSILLLVLVTLVAVVGYNFWQNRRHRSQFDSVAPTERAPAEAPAARSLSAEHRLEPVLPADLVDVAPHGTRLETTHGATPGTTQGATLPAEPPATEVPHVARVITQAPLSELTDCIVEMPLTANLGGDRLLQLTQTFRRAGGKPVLFEGMPASVDPERLQSARAGPDAAAGDLQGEQAQSSAQSSIWEMFTPGQTYRAIRVGILLANRHGPLNAMEFSEFVNGVQAVAEALAVLADIPDMTVVLANARELDSACASLDAQIGINVDAAEPLALSDLERLAAVHGLTERGNNRYACLGAGGELLFSVALADSTRRLTLLLDVPRAPAAQAPWQKLIACAAGCAQQLGGKLMDDADRPLTEQALERIGTQLAARYESLARAGFPAGSAQALRLFN